MCCPGPPCTTDMICKPYECIPPELSEPFSYQHQYRLLSSDPGTCTLLQQSATDQQQLIGPVTVQNSATDMLTEFRKTMEVNCIVSLILSQGLEDPKNFLTILNITQTEQGLPIATIPKYAIDISRKLQINKKVNKSPTQITEPVLPTKNLNLQHHPTSPLASGLQPSDIPCPNQPLLPPTLPQLHTPQPSDPHLTATPGSTQPIPYPNSIHQNLPHHSQPTPIDRPI
ncbi:unnamed protein product [Meganyctiphanes norvegica]|uniref:Uncharacterized protein n=1 Tax=Meganyctiphanes norvegica TaxID=48144 RepID=A0AAV2SK34_MEGNR